MDCTKSEPGCGLCSLVLMDSIVALILLVLAASSDANKRL